MKIIKRFLTKQDKPDPSLKENIEFDKIKEQINTLEKSVHLLGVNINKLITINKNIEELLIQIATSQEEFLNQLYGSNYDEKSFNVDETIKMIEKDKKTLN